MCCADFVDVGVGMIQCGPYHCEACGASQRGPYDTPRPLSAIEEKTGWYGPGTEPGSSANIIEGRHVGHQEMQQAYRDEFVDNPLWSDKAYTEKWRNDIRKG